MNILYHIILYIYEYITALTEDPVPLEAPREWTPSNRGPPAAVDGHNHHDDHGEYGNGVDDVSLGVGDGGDDVRHQ